MRKVALGTILVLAVLVFSRAWISGYVLWDDNVLIQGNPALTLPFGRALVVFFSRFYDGDYIPLVFTSYWLELRALGLGARGQHIVNLVLHLLNVVLLWRLLARARFDGWITAWICAIFALHPLQVESVMWISERKGILSATFLLLSVMAFFSRRNWVSRIGYPLGYLLSLLAKTQGILLPLILAFADRFIRKRTWQETLVRQGPALLILVALAVIRIRSYGGQVDVVSLALDTDWVFELPWIVFSAIGFYVAKFFWPFHLAIIYPSYGSHDWPYGMLAVGVGLLAALAYRRFRDRRILLALGTAFCFLAPVLQFIPRINFVNDRYAYLPIAAFAAALGLVVADSGVGPRIKAGIGAFAISTLAAVAFVRTGIWVDSLALWSDTVREVPNSAVAYNNLGLLLDQKGEKEEARLDFERAIAADPKYGDAYNNLAIYYENARDYSRALQNYQRAVEFGPEMPEARANLGDLYEKLGYHDRALAELSRAIALRPGMVEAHRALAKVYEATGQHEAAERERQWLKTSSVNQ